MHHRNLKALAMQFNRFRNHERFSNTKLVLLVLYASFFEVKEQVVSQKLNLLFLALHCYYCKYILCLVKRFSFIFFWGMRFDSSNCTWFVFFYLFWQEMSQHKGTSTVVMVIDLIDDADKISVNICNLTIFLTKILEKPTSPEAFIL